MPFFFPNLEYITLNESSMITQLTYIFIVQSPVYLIPGSFAYALKVSNILYNTAVNDFHLNVDFV